MQCYGVKLKTGKVMWVQAETVEVHDGMLLFVSGTAEARRVLAGFAIASVDHFGLPEAFVSAQEPAQ